MSYGMSILNSNGDEILYGAEKAFVLIQKGTTTFSEGQFITSNFKGTEQPLIFVVNGGAVIQWKRNAQGYWEFNLFRPHDGAPSLTYEWYMFAPQPNVVNINYGLSLYGDNGELNYNSGYQPLIIKKYGLLANRGDSYSISGISKPAVRATPSRVYGWSGTQQSGGIRAELAVVNCTTTTVSLSHYLTVRLGSVGIAARLGHWNKILSSVIDANDY